MPEASYILRRELSPQERPQQALCHPLKTPLITAWSPEHPGFPIPVNSFSINLRGFCCFVLRNRGKRQQTTTNNNNATLLDLGSCREDDIMISKMCSGSEEQSLRKASTSSRHVRGSKYSILRSLGDTTIDH